jgi:hypothetical protein
LCFRSPFLRSLLASALAAAVLAGLGATASTAAECLENPDYRVTGPGHWYYHMDRTLNRRCWYFGPAEGTASVPAPAAPAATATTAAAPDEPSLLSRFAAALSQPLSPPQPQLQQTQQNSIPDNAGEAAQTLSPKPAKSNRTVRRERPQPAPQPTTTGAAERHVQTAAAEKSEKNEKGEKNEKRDPPLNVAEREALFQDFMKWQLQRNVFGHP